MQTSLRYFKFIEAYNAGIWSENNQSLFIVVLILNFVVSMDVFQLVFRPGSDVFFFPKTKL